MRRLSQTFHVTALLWVLTACAGATQQQTGTTGTRTNAAAAAMQDFTQRVNAYVDLHKQAVGKTAAPKESADTAEIQAARDILAAAIQSMRKDAKPGDIFTPAVRRTFRSLINPEFKGRDGAETKEIMSEDAATGVPIKVNVPYPASAPVTTMPPNVLKRLPVLPEGLEYRIVGRTLILRDVDANLIVDYMTNAIPAAIKAEKQ